MRRRPGLGALTSQSCATGSASPPTATSLQRVGRVGRWSGLRSGLRAFTRPVLEVVHTARAKVVLAAAHFSFNVLMKACGNLKRGSAHAPEVTEESDDKRGCRVRVRAAARGDGRVGHT